MSAKKPRLLVIDDQDRYIELAHALLRDYDYVTRCDRPGPCWTCEVRPGCTLTHAHNAREALESLEDNAEVDAVLLDVSFQIPEEELLRREGEPVSHARRFQGISILKRIRNQRGDVPIILLTSEEELELEGIDAALLADEFVTLAGSDAFDARAVELLVERTLAQSHQSLGAGGYSFGQTRAMAEVGREAVAMSRTSLPMLVTGEPGTGKSALSEHIIHPKSGRVGKHVAVDLSSIPPQLVAAELFGTEKGAFSGAVERDGFFLRAHRGTLLLDEIGNLSHEVQRLLLLVLQNRRITRLGATEPIPIDVKLVAATNANLEEQVRKGQFRADLYARLNPAARLSLPPLRERLEDLPDLMRGFVKKTFAQGADRALLLSFQRAAGIQGTPNARLILGPGPDSAPAGTTFLLSKHVLSLLRKHTWPGNLRELSLLASTSALLALSDATRAIEEGRAKTETPWAIPIPARLVRKLLSASWTDPAHLTPTIHDRFVPVVEPETTLRKQAKSLEAQLYRYWFFRSGGDFEEMANGLLTGTEPDRAKKVRLRFNQLGLRARELQKSKFFKK